MAKGEGQRKIKTTLCVFVTHVCCTNKVILDGWVFFFSYADGPLPVHIYFEQKAHVTCCFIQRHQPQCFVPVIIFINFKQSVVLHRSEWPYYRKFICTLSFFFLVINSYILSWLEKRTGNSVLFPCLIISHQSQYTNTSLSTPWKICKKNKLYQFSAGERKS